MDNIYHCCMHKTGSQWIKKVLADEIVLKKTGMSIYTYQQHLPTKGDPRKLTERMFATPFPLNCIITPLYMDYNSYISIPKPAEYRTFCIIRDPRDIIVSWYFSVKNSHPLMGKIPQHREMLNQISLQDGMLYCLGYLNDYGLFESLRSWIKGASEESPLNLKIYRFEELMAPELQLTILTDLFVHCGISLTNVEIALLIDKYSFKRLQEEAKTGFSHYRKGEPGNWKEFFNEEVSNTFKQFSQNLVEELGYEP